MKSCYKIGAYHVFTDDRGRVHHAVNYNSRNPVTLYPYEPCRAGGLDNCCGFYTVSQIRGKMRRGTICFR